MKLMKDFRKYWVILHVTQLLSNCRSIHQDCTLNWQIRRKIEDKYFQSNGVKHQEHFASLSQHIDTQGKEEEGIHVLLSKLILRQRSVIILLTVQPLIDSRKIIREGELV